MKVKRFHEANSTFTVRHPRSRSSPLSDEKLLSNTIEEVSDSQNDRILSSSSSTTLRSIGMSKEPRNHFCDGLG